MSIIIELSQVTERLSLEQQKPQNFTQAIRTVLAQEEFQLKHFQVVCRKNYSQNEQIVSIIGKSKNTFIRDMQWNFIAMLSELRLKIHFFDQNRSNFLRTKSQRMRLELMILLRNVNEQLSSQEQFVVIPQNNLLQYQFRIGWKQYKLKIPKIQALKRFLRYLISRINQFQQIIYFCEPQFIKNTEQHSKQLHLCDEFYKITNNFRIIMMNAINLRKENNKHIAKMHALKQHKPQNQHEQDLIKKQYNKTLQLFHHNINTLYQQSLGLQQTEDNKQIYTKCLNQISLNQNHANKIPPFDLERSQYLRNKEEIAKLNTIKCIPYSAQAISNRIVPSTSLFNSSQVDPDNKIVYGIMVVKSQKQKVISKQGAHSQIYRAMCLYKLVSSINLEVITSQEDKWITKTESKSELTIKKCNLINQTSKNSFMNELYFLNYIRDFHCPFIGKYYLEMKNFRQRSQKDSIFMKSYYNNLDYILRKCLTLNIKDRLNLLYRISKGLCFLASKNIVHRDLKPHNIVLSTTLAPHIIDFGSWCNSYGSNSFNPFDKRLLTSKYFHIHYHQIPESYHYIYQSMSKEEYQQHPLFDIYSFGKIISLAMFGTLEFPICEQIAGSSFSDLLKNLVFLGQLCLNVNPDDRPTIAELSGFLGSLSKFYSSYHEYFKQKTKESPQRRSHSQTKYTQQIQ